MPIYIVFVYYQLFCGLLLNTNRKQEVCLPYTTHICVDQFQLENNRKCLMEMLNEALKKSLRNTNWYISSEHTRTLFQLLNVIVVAMHFHMIV